MSTPSENTPFRKPDTVQVERWYDWAVKRVNNQHNPFHPTNGGQYWDFENTDQELIWLAGATATTQPAKKPSQIPNLDAIVAGAQAKAVYNDGDGEAVQDLPPVNPRDISIKGDNRDLYIPVSTELATATKYPKQVNNLSQLSSENN